MRERGRNLKFFYKILYFTISQFYWSSSNELLIFKIQFIILLKTSLSTPLISTTFRSLTVLLNKQNGSYQFIIKIGFFTPSSPKLVIRLICVLLSRLWIVIDIIIINYYRTRSIDCFWRETYVVLVEVDYGKGIKAERILNWEVFLMFLLSIIFFRLNNLTSFFLNRLQRSSSMLY